jgi:hypothetical protein
MQKNKPQTSNLKPETISNMQGAIGNLSTREMVKRKM